MVTPKVCEVRIGPKGRVVIPVEARAALGLEEGTVVLVEYDGNSLVLRSREAVKRRLLEMFAGTEGSMADELVAERRAEAERETGP